MTVRGFGCILTFCCQLVRKGNYWNSTHDESLTKSCIKLIYTYFLNNTAFVRFKQLTSFLNIDRTRLIHWRTNSHSEITWDNFYFNIYFFNKAASFFLLYLARLLGSDSLRRTNKQFTGASQYFSYLIQIIETGRRPRTLPRILSLLLWPLGHDWLNLWTS